MLLHERLAGYRRLVLLPRFGHAETAYTRDFAPLLDSLVDDLYSTGGAGNATTRGRGVATRWGLIAIGLLAIAPGCTGNRGDTPTVASSASSDGVTTIPPGSLTTPAPAATACAAGTLTVSSAVLGRSVRVSVLSIAPLAQVTAVVYLLHGANTDETQWPAIGAEDARLHFAPTGAATTMAVVLPDLPSAAIGVNDEAALVQEVIPSVESCFGGAIDRVHRAVGGISRGGQVTVGCRRTPRPLHCGRRAQPRHREATRWPCSR